MKQVFAIDGRNGSFLEFEDGQFVDTVVGDRDVDFEVDPDDPYNSAIQYANGLGYEWVSEPVWSSWYPLGTVDIFAHVGAEF